jgi:hypothetical protein
MLSNKLSDGNKGLIISIIILIGLLLICHISNYMNPKPVHSEQFNSIYFAPANTKYTEIGYYDLLNEKKICDDLAQANIPCPTKSCAKELTDYDMALLYRVMYNRAGLEIMKRTLDSEHIV